MRPGDPKIAGALCRPVCVAACGTAAAADDSLCPYQTRFGALKSGRFLFKGVIRPDSAEIVSRSLAGYLPAGWRPVREFASYSRHLR